MHCLVSSPLPLTLASRVLNLLCKENKSFELAVGSPSKLDGESWGWGRKGWTKHELTGDFKWFLNLFENEILPGSHAPHPTAITEDPSHRHCRILLAKCLGSKLKQSDQTLFEANLPEIYPLVNIQKTMENHHFLWENSLFLWPFSIAMLNYQRVPWIYQMLWPIWDTLEQRKYTCDALRFATQHFETMLVPQRATVVTSTVTSLSPLLTDVHMLWYVVITFYCWSLLVVAGCV